MPLKTIDREPTFTINGTSVLSAVTYTLIELIEDLKAIDNLQKGRLLRLQAQLNF